MFDPNASLELARDMARHAKSGSLIVDNVRYLLTFNQQTWGYDVTNDRGKVLVSFNTKKLTQARKWLREYLAN